MATWTAAYVNDLPDSAFACIDSNGRHYPHHDAQGSLDLPHLRAALSRIGDPSNAQCGKAHLTSHARAAGVGQEGKAEPLDPDELSGWLAGKRPRRVLAIPFGGPLPNPSYAKGMDLDFEWFSERTDIKPKWFDARPITWQHGDDRRMGNEPFGKATDLELDEDGWWVQAWLDAHDKRLALIGQLTRELEKRGKHLMGSSAPIGRFVKRSKAGEILVWPYAEQTFGTAVQNSKSIVAPGKALADFDLAGIPVAQVVRDLFTELDANGADLPTTLAASEPPSEWAAKAGRVLSAANEAAIRDAQAKLAEVLAKLERALTAGEEEITT